ncbi:hypothetical protein [Novosphingobium sp.]|jgi:hypothetical protein|uniref:hypothetical protein n=1 Tax=Novosphingobium sp. TaxID=1874826 RepID=UPI002FE1E24D
MKSSTLVIAPTGIAEAAEQSVSPFAGIGKHQVVHGSGDETGPAPIAEIRDPICPAMDWKIDRNCFSFKGKYVIRCRSHFW